ncbi:unnamed protein product [Microthlaspi erraticum]|uniref:Uncharacterized protein n=1 Tax=Microthlaspi erraticum TaxID=1685480 RepID=A0A6D2IR15_9BRAS|nr:unnamed protein product [Microthlaspi erraticum]
MEQKESNHQVPKSRAPNLYFSLKTKPEHPKYDRIFMPSRRPKVMILIWKDRYLSHDPRRSGKRSFGSLVGRNLFSTKTCPKRLSRAHGDFDVFWSILEHMGHEEHGGTWHMEAAQLDTQRKKGEAILKTSSTVHSTNRSSSSTRPAKLQLDRAGSQSQTRKMLLPP